MVLSRREFHRLRKRERKAIDRNNVSVIRRNARPFNHADRPTRDGESAFLQRGKLNGNTVKPVALIPAPGVPVGLPIVADALRVVGVSFNAASLRDLDGFFDVGIRVNVAEFKRVVGCAVVKLPRRMALYYDA